MDTLEAALADQGAQRLRDAVAASWAFGVGDAAVPVETTMRRLVRGGGPRP